MSKNNISKVLSLNKKL